MFAAKFEDCGNRARDRGEKSRLTRGSGLGYFNFDRAHFAQWMSRGCGKGLLNLRDDGERDGGGRLRAKIETGGCVQLSQPLFSTIRGDGKMEQACGFKKQLARAPLWSQDAEIGKGEYAWIA
jgi:hypothetical protein